MFQKTIPPQSQTPKFPFRQASFTYNSNFYVTGGQIDIFSINKFDTKKLKWKIVKIPEKLIEDLFAFQDHSCLVYGDTLYMHSGVYLNY